MKVFQAVRTRKAVKELLDVLELREVKGTIKREFAFSQLPSGLRMQEAFIFLSCEQSGFLQCSSFLRLSSRKEKCWTKLIILNHNMAYLQEFQRTSSEKQLDTWDSWVWKYVVSQRKMPWYQSIKRDNTDCTCN